MRGLFMERTSHVWIHALQLGYGLFVLVIVQVCLPGCLLLLWLFLCCLWGFV